MNTEKKHIIIAGAGPAGMMAAIAAAGRGAEVTVLEGMTKPGKKLLLTGNGRCNITNLSPDPALQYMSSGTIPASEFAGSVLAVFSVRDTIDFFREAGLMLTDKGLWVYPGSGQALSVLNVLLREMERLRVKLKLNTKVRGIRYEEENGKWKVSTGSWEYTADSVILACGSKAAPSTGSDGSGYEIAGGCGIKVEAPLPVLTALTSDDPYIKTAAGARTYAGLSLFAGEHLLAEETGELQWTEYGISGIAVFQLSRYLRGKLSDCRKNDILVTADLVPALSKTELAGRIRKTQERFGDSLAPEEILGGYTNTKVAEYLLKREKGTAAQRDQTHKKTNISVEKSTGAGEKNPEKLAGMLKSVRIHITGRRSFEHAQTTAGGVDTGMLTPGTLEAADRPGLFFAGEIIDIDGPCGGYNLQWAWSSGYAAGTAAAGK